MLRLSSTLLSLLFFSTTVCAQVFWNGGSGSWNVAANWSTGSLPTSNDQVFLGNNNKVVIPSYFTARAARVVVGTGTLLGIQRRATLEIDGISNFALENFGEVSISGGLIVHGNGTSTAAIHNEGEIGTSTQAKILIEDVILAIQNLGEFISGADMEIRNVQGLPNSSVIICLDNGYFYNNRYGQISIHNASRNGITIGADAAFENAGELVLKAPIGGNGITNLGYFENHGYVGMDDFVGRGVINQNAIFENTGQLEILNTSNSGRGLENSASGSFINGSGAEIWIEGDNLERGLYQSGSSDFANQGLLSLDVDGNGRALYIYSGDFVSTGQIDVKGTSSYGLYIRTNNFTNEGRGEINVNKNAGIGLYATGGARIYNQSLSTLSINRPVQLASSSLLFNDAWLELRQGSANGSTISYSSSLWNDGLVFDEEGWLLTIPAQNRPNGGIVADPIYGNVSNGVPVYNALRVATTNNDVSVAYHWRASSGGSSIGTYSYSQNRFTPNFSGAGGYSAVYVEFELDNVVRRTYAIPVPNGIQARGGGAPVQPEADANLQSPFVANESFQAFPNPADQQLQLLLPAKWQGQLQLQLYSLSGQQLWRGIAETTDAPYRLARPEGLPGGTYLLRLIDEQGGQAQQRIVFR
ncbi:MAG: T9SS type A sorting domain-containing protein [Bacteroidota bacterium]